MTKTLKRNELADIRDSFLALNQATRTWRNELEDKGLITKANSNRIGQHEDQLALIADDFNDVILRQVLADIEQPSQRIISVTEDLKNAVNTLKSLNDFIGVLAAVITLATTVLTAFTTGNPLVLVSVLDQIEALV